MERTETVTEKSPEYQQKRDPSTPWGFSEEVLVYTPRFSSVRAIQWTGRNFEQVNEFIPVVQLSGGVLETRNSKKTVLLGWYIVQDQSSDVFVLTEAEFNNEYESSN